MKQSPEAFLIPGVFASATTADESRVRHALHKRAKLLRPGNGRNQLNIHNRVRVGLKVRGDAMPD
jgi:hypothetical protein